MDRRPNAPLLCLLLWLVAAASNAAEVRIHRAEAFTLPAKALPDSATLSKSAPGSRGTVSFAAYGKSFNLELTDNSELLARLPADRHNAIAVRNQLYGGRLQGHPQSWVRLTRAGTAIYGLIYDGEEFYAIAPRRTVESLLDTGAVAAAADSNLIYRASDMDVDFGGSFCSAVRVDGRTGRVNGKEAYEAVLRELAATTAAAGAPTREVEVGLLGDLQFYQRQGVDSEDALIARFNIVDGIFSEQVDLRITIGSLQVFQSGNPFTTNDPEDLLDQVGAYRQSHSALQAFGLTHLVTGRALDGTTVGIAFVESVCDPYFGSSLSEDMGFDVTLSALVSAHELGHNFGADHDNEPGGACASTPNGYLMAPRISGSSTFSQCSLDTMAPVIAAAPCVFAARIRDISVIAVSSAVSSLARTPFAVEFDVESVGNTPVDDIEVVLLSDDYIVELVSASAAGGTCGIDNRQARCSLGTLAPGTRRRITVNLTGRQAGEAQLVAAMANADDRDDNDSARVDLFFNPRVDVSVTGDASAPPILLGDSITLNYFVSVDGVDAADDVEFRLPTGNLSVISATATGGTCSNSGVYVSCALGTVAAGSIRPISITATGTSVGSSSLNGLVSATVDDRRGNESVRTSYRVLPRSDLRLTAQVDQLLEDVGAEVPVDFVVASTGVDPVGPGALFTVDAYGDDQAVIVGVTADAASCSAAAPTTWTCTLDASPAGTSRRIAVTLQATGATLVTVIAGVSAPDDQDSSNSSANVLVQFQERRDLAISGPGSASGYDDRPMRLQIGMYSLGRAASTNTIITVALPDTVVPISAIASAGTCTVQPGSVRCQIGTIEADTNASVEIRVQSEVPGHFYGTATVESDGDGDARNDQVTIEFRVNPAYDVALSLPNSVMARPDELTEVPVTLETSRHPFNSATLQFQVNDSSIIIDSANTDHGTCAISGANVTCALDALAAESIVTVTVTLRGSKVGTYYIDAWASTSPADIDGSNSQDTTQLTIEAAPAPPPPSSGGGGGGGGRLDLAMLLALSLLTAIGQRRRGRCRQPSARSPRRPATRRPGLSAFPH